MNTQKRRQAALAKRLRVSEGELEPFEDESFVGSRFRLQPGGLYQVYSSDEEKQAFKARVPDVPFVGQIHDAEGETYNVYLAVERAPTPLDAAQPQ